MLPRLLLVVGLTISVMLPLIWAAFAPVPGFREASEPAADPAHSGSAGADWRGAPTPEAAAPANSTAGSNEATIGTAPVSEGEASAARSDDLPRAAVSEPTLIKPDLPPVYDKEAAPETLLSEEAKPLPEEAKPPPKEVTTPTVSEEEASAARSDDLPGAGVSEPTLIKPSLPQAYDKEAAPEPLVSEKAKSPPKEATTPTVNVEKLPEVKKPPSAPGASHNSRSRARADGTGSRQKMHRKKQRYRSGWVDIMREAGWLAPGRRR